MVVAVGYICRDQARGEVRSIFTGAAHRPWSDIGSGRRLLAASGAIWGPRRPSETSWEHLGPPWTSRTHIGAAKVVSHSPGSNFYPHVTACRLTDPADGSVWCRSF